MKEINQKRLYDSNYMTFGKGKTMETVENTNGCQDWEGGEDKRAAHRGLLGQ